MKIELVHITCPTCHTAVENRLPRCPTCGTEIKWPDYVLPPDWDKPSKVEKKK